MVMQKPSAFVALLAYFINTNLIYYAPSYSGGGPQKPVFRYLRRAGKYICLAGTR